MDGDEESVGKPAERSELTKEDSASTDETTNDAVDSALLTPTKKTTNLQAKSPTKPPGTLTPEGRRYRILYGELKQKYLAQCKTLEQMETSEKSNESSKPYVMKMCNDDIFVAKLKKGSKGPTKGCEISGCDKLDVDLIKCNMCGNLVCEECSGVKVSKLRLTMNQCKTLYFTCPSCDVQIRDNSDVNAYDVLKGKLEAMSEELGSCETANDKLQQQVKTLDEQQTSLKLLLEERETSLHETEAKLISVEQGAATSNNESTGTTSIEELISKRFDNIDKSIESLIDKKLAGVLSLPTTEKPDSGDANNKKTFAEKVGGTTDPLTAAFLNNKNQEMVHQRERERRSANLIIYGIKEESNDDQPEQDKAFISSLLEKIGVAQRPKQIFRLGKRGDDKTRPVKITMENEGEKDTIMARLGNLKNAEDAFRKVSIREDYTLEEREMVREMVKRAEAKNDAENTNEWKVRGTPKTGLKVVRITRRQR